MGLSGGDVEVSFEGGMRNDSLSSFSTNKKEKTKLKVNF